MRLSPLDIRKQSFSKKLRGIDGEEVQAFLEMMSHQWEEVLDETRRLEDRVREMEAKLDHYEKVEEALQEALQTARESSERRLQNAEEQADIIVKEAESEAKHIVHDAREERERARREFDMLTDKSRELTARLRSFLTAELEMMGNFTEQAALPAPSTTREAAGSRESGNPQVRQETSERAARRETSAARSRPEASSARTYSTEKHYQPSQEAPGASEAPARQAAASEARSKEGSGSAPSDADAPESDELAKIRRILNDLD